MRQFKTALAAGLALSLLSGIALADTVKFNADLGPDPQAQNKGSAKGSAAISLDTATKTLSYKIDYNGLSGPPAMAAFLSPPAKQGAPPGTVEIKLPAKPASPLEGSLKLTDAQITGIKSGQWLLLIGSKQAPEIGGEVKPAP